MFCFICGLFSIILCGWISNSFPIVVSAYGYDPPNEMNVQVSLLEINVDTQTQPGAADGYILNGHQGKVPVAAATR